MTALKGLSLKMNDHASEKKGLITGQYQHAPIKFLRYLILTRAQRQTVRFKSKGVVVVLADKLSHVYILPHISA